MGNDAAGGRRKSSKGATGGGGTGAPVPDGGGKGGDNDSPDPVNCCHSLIQDLFAMLKPQTSRYRRFRPTRFQFLLNVSSAVQKGHPSLS
jgi:hypothetical protein